MTCICSILDFYHIFTIQIALVIFKVFYIWNKHYFKLLVYTSSNNYHIYINFCPFLKSIPPSQIVSKALSIDSDWFRLMCLSQSYFVIQPQISDRNNSHRSFFLELKYKVKDTFLREKNLYLIVGYIQHTFLFKKSDII